MADGEVRAQDLTAETTSTLSGNEQFVMFDSTEGKRADIDDVATYIAGDKTQLQTDNKTSPVAAINENHQAIGDLKEDISTAIQFSTYAGYPNITGTIAPATASGEVYSEKIYVKYIKTIDITIEYSQTRGHFTGVGVYYADGTFSRVTLNQANNKKWHTRYTIPTNAVNIIIFYRTYGESNICTVLLDGWQNNIASAKNKDNDGYSGSVVTIVEHNGYLNEQGVVLAQSANKEKYTDKIPVTFIDSIEWSIAYTGRNNTWVAYGVYYADGTFQRTVILNNFTCQVASGVVKVPNNATDIVFMYRTFGESNVFSAEVKGWKNDKANSAIAKTALVDGNVERSSIGLFLGRLKPVYDHLFATRTGANIVIPHESLFHVRISKKLGYNCIEANTEATSDGVYVVNHFNNGKFGGYFHHVDGETDISNIAVSSVTWDWIVQNVRYNSTIPKYRTRPCRLEEFLGECRQQNIIPFVQATTQAIIDICDKYMGVGNYIAYNATRAICPNGIIYEWTSHATKEAILAYCENIGKPMIYGLANPYDFSDSDLQDIVDTLHKNGYWIGSSYIDGNWSKYSAMGFDYNGSQHFVNRIETGNLHNLNTVFSFGSFTFTNATETNGTLTYSATGTLTPNISDTVYPICMIDLEMWFNGSIAVDTIGEYGNLTYTSDGSSPVFMCVPIINGSPKVMLRPTSGTIVYDVKYKASVC